MKAIAALIAVAVGAGIAAAAIYGVPLGIASLVGLSAFGIGFLFLIVLELIGPSKPAK